MKLTTTLTTKRNAGMTLLELTVVILVLLSLISILFVGARAWKKGSDRAACILNIRNVQQAVRGHQNMHNKLAADTLDSAVIYSATAADAYLKPPVCPGAGTYTAGTSYGAPGTLYLACSLAVSAEHIPTGSGDW